MVRRNAAQMEQGYDLVVAGASAGGIEALSVLVASLPPDFAAALVIAQHLDPAHVSHLGDILSHRTSLAVHTVLEQETLAPGVIYVVPADRDVEITDHQVRLQPSTAHHSTPSVNRLFSSAAHTYGERLIGVILTGAGSDGASGAHDVKAAGGLVIIENPATAAYASMPQSLALTSVDLVVDLPQIGPLLADLVAGSYSPAPAEAEATLPVLLAHVREHSGIDFSSYKLPTILRRLQRRLAATRMDSLEAYIGYLADHPEEYQHLTSSFLINVTEFFRDPDLFAALRAEILPALIAHARAHSGSLRVWSAGCATGEEAYSLALLIADLLGDELESVNVRIFATDADADAIAFARRGVYPAAALAALPDELVARAFIRVDGAYEIIPRVRNLVIFGQHDLGQRAPFPHIDLVLCRNVLIYFTAELQQRALQLFAFALRDGGYLALGKAETPAVIGPYFVPVQSPLKLYRRQGARVLVPPPRIVFPIPLSLPHSIAHRPPFVVPAAPSPVPRSTVNEQVGSVLLNSSLGVVVVDRRYDIQAINRTAQQLLGIYRASLGEDLIHLVTTVAALDLRAAIDAAWTSDRPSEALLEATSGEARLLQITAVAASTAAGSVPPDTVLVQISDVTARVQAQRAAVAPRTPPAVEVPASSPRRTPGNQRAHAWEQERRQFQEAIARLTTQRDQAIALTRTLGAANDELASANLHMTSFNEDLMVRNEELQAFTEEIKTLNEELQATNEELETLTEEMEATVEELHATNEDLVVRTNEVQHLATLREEQRLASEAKAVELAAILLSVGDALLVLNQAGEILYANTAYSAYFGSAAAPLVAEDQTGRPLPPAQTPQHRVLTGDSFQMTFTQSLPDGGRRWLEANGEPIRVNGVPTGGVVTIRDITDRSLQRLQDEFLALVNHDLRTPLTAIQVAAQMLDRSWGDAEGRVSFLLAIIQRQVRRIQRLIDDLSDVSRLQHGQLRLEMQAVDLREIAARTVEAVSLVAPLPAIVLEAAEPLPIVGDAVRLEQILTNLLTNASKYAAESPQIVVRLQRVAGEAEVQVQDTGPGIAAADLPKLFQRFFQADPQATTSHSGLGLGLFIAHELVVAHGGRIAVRSQEGQGTTFTLHFPLLQPVSRPDARLLDAEADVTRGAD